MVPAAHTHTHTHIQGKKGELQKMYEEWPFFAATIDLIEMILAKADMRIAGLYDDVLVDDATGKKLGSDLRQKFYDTVRGVCEVTRHQRLLQTNPALRRLIEMRNPYIDPINILQVRCAHALAAAAALVCTLSGQRPHAPVDMHCRVTVCRSV